MPAWRSTLDRFLPAGSAGVVAGVPADRTADANAELAPVLAELARVRSRAGTIRRDAADRAQARRQEASRQEVVLVAEATTRAESARLASATHVVDAARAETEATAATAAAGIRRMLLPAGVFPRSCAGVTRGPRDRRPTRR